MYEIEFPKLDINANNMGFSSTREKSARERSKLRRSKSTHTMDFRQRPKSHRFRREKDFDLPYVFPHEVQMLDLEDPNICNAAAWCVSFDADSHAERVSCSLLGQVVGSKPSQNKESKLSDQWFKILQQQLNFWQASQKWNIIGINVSCLPKLIALVCNMHLVK